MVAEWTETTLADLGRIVTGKTPSTANSANFGGAIQFITPSDMDGRRLISATSRCLTEEGAASIAGARIPSGAVLISCIGSDMGKAAVAAKPSVTNQQINSIIVDAPNSSLFVYYDLSRRKEEIRQTAGGSAQPILNKTAFGRLPIRLPDPIEQRAIAHILGTLDDKIELNCRMNKTLESIAHALFKSWFVDFDPVRAKAAGQQPSGMDVETAKFFPSGFENSDLGKLPKEWRVASIADLGDVVTGKTPSTSQREFFGKAYPFIKIPDMHGRMWVSSTQDGLSDAGHQEQPGKLVPPKSVAVSCIATVGLVALVRYPSHTNQQINVVVPANGTSWTWLLFALRHLSPEIEARSLGGSVTKNLNKGQFESIRLVVPPEKVQRSFEAAISPACESIAANDDESQLLATVRDALLPKLISGELRVESVVRLVDASIRGAGRE